MKKLHPLVFAAVAGFILMPAVSVALDPENPPEEIRALVEPGMFLHRLDSGDLNGDGREDYILVVAGHPRSFSDDEPLFKKYSDAARKPRTLLIVVRQPDHSLRLKKRNDKLVGCDTCGGGRGDPLDELELEPKAFTVRNYWGGSRYGHSQTYRFGYSRRDDTWQLVRVEVSRWRTPASGNEEEEEGEELTYIPPRDFGRIDIADFDPQHYLGQGAGAQSATTCGLASGVSCKAGRTSAGTEHPAQ